MFKYHPINKHIMLTWSVNTCLRCGIKRWTRIYISLIQVVSHIGAGYWDRALEHDFPNENNLIEIYSTNKFVQVANIANQNRLSSHQSTSGHHLTPWLVHTATRTHVSTPACWFQFTVFSRFDTLSLMSDI